MNRIILAATMKNWVHILHQIVGVYESSMKILVQVGLLEIVLITNILDYIGKTQIFHT